MSLQATRPDLWNRFALEFATSNWTETFISPTTKRRDTLHRYAQEGHLVSLGLFQREGIFVLGDRASYLFAPTLATLRLLAESLGPGSDDLEDLKAFREFRASFAFAPDEGSRRWVQMMWENWHLQHLHLPLLPQHSFSYLLEPY